MILTDLAHLDRYLGLSDALDAGIRWLKTTDLAALPVGRHEIDSDRVFCNCQSYEAKTGEAVYEAHRRYIDIQLIVSGTERMGYAPVDALNVTKAYDEAADCVLGTASGSMFEAPVGTAAIFFPEDAHAPGRAADAVDQVKKCVVKVKID